MQQQQEQQQHQQHQQQQQQMPQNRMNMFRMPQRGMPLEMQGMHQNQFVPIQPQITAQQILAQQKGTKQNG